MSLPIIGTRVRPSESWFKSSFSNPNGNQCVEARFTQDSVRIRDSKQHGNGPVLEVPGQYWGTFQTDVLRGESSNTAVHIDRQTDGDVILRSRARPGVALRYTAEEWSAFAAGVAEGEFDFLAPAGSLAVR